MKSQVLSALLLSSLAFGGVAFAQGNTSPAGTPSQEVKQDVQQLKQDKQELKKDVKEDKAKIKADHKKIRSDKKAMKKEIKQSQPVTK
jgi:hypothetical protein